MRWWFFVLALGTVQGQETCLSVNDDPYLQFGSKTAYLFATRGSTAPNNNWIQNIPGCQPLAFWLASRHGSTNPDEKELPALKNLGDFRQIILGNYRNGNFRDTNQRMCTADVNLLGQWLWNSRLNTTYAGRLTSEGYMTSQQLAKGWKQKFPGLLTDNPHDYLFKYVEDRFSEDHYHAFTEGLFRTEAETYDIPKDNDEKRIRPDKSCPTWSNYIKDNETLSQKHIFESKQEYKEMISNISRRLGYNYDLQSEFVYSMYDMCRYNKAWDVTKISPWCAVFTREDLKRLEYAEDLETYYKYGYGSKLSSNIGCTLLNDMISFFTKHVENDLPQQPKAQIHLTDSEMLLTLLTTMGTHQDTAPITGDNYHTNIAQTRKWTTSTMSPFNANVAAVLYKCTSNGNYQVNDRYQVLLMENERPIFIEGCRVGLCDWSQVISKYGEIANKCTNEFCNDANRAVGVSTIVLAFALVLSTVL